MSEFRRRRLRRWLLPPLTWWILDLAASVKAVNSVFWFTPSLLELLFWEKSRIHFKEPNPAEAVLQSSPDGNNTLVITHCCLLLQP